jgi:hypothetical protein
MKEDLKVMVPPFITLSILIQITAVMVLTGQGVETGNREFCDWSPKTPIGVVGSALSYPTRKIACFLSWRFEDEN